MLHYKDAIQVPTTITNLVTKTLNVGTGSVVYPLATSYAQEALAQVQLAYGVALVTAEVIWTDDEVSDKETRLPIPAKVINSVRVDGEECSYTLIGNTIVKLHREGRTCEVLYRCGTPVTHDVDFFAPMIAEYVRARVEGQTKQEASRFLL